MRVAVPILGTGIVGLAVGCLLALTYGRPLLRGAVWGAGGGLAFGAIAALILAVNP
jgi:hypothetical protein